ncbi:MAG: hypothetical protein ACKESB_02770 [Candidatus Hodgkinia cicadicola]
MIQGVSSNAGKTFLCTCLCEAARRMGVLAAPFKAQNMSGSVMAAADGGEMSTAQWVQALACGISKRVSESF